MTFNSLTVPRATSARSTWSFLVVALLYTFLGLGPALAQVTGNLTTLYTFAGDAGGESPAGLILANDGNFYGVTQFGGAARSGTIFQRTPAGTVTILYSLTAADGGFPSGLIQGLDGKLYGVTTGGNGTLFRFDVATGVYTTLHTFDGGSGGKTPNEDLALDASGNLYGTTVEGGNSDSSCTQTFSGSCGTVFRFNVAAGTLDTLYRFLNDISGYGPNAGLVLANDGNFYGTAAYGGSSAAAGIIFRITSAGAFTKITDVPGDGVRARGSSPRTTLTQSRTDGQLYGGTRGGGLSAGLGSYGVIFRVPLSGSPYQVVYRFTGGSNGISPSTRLLQAANNNFYGTTDAGGTLSTISTVFRVDGATGQLATLHEFLENTDGSQPSSNLIESTPTGGLATFYGSTTLSNPGFGTLFSVVDPLLPAPVVSSISPTSGAVGDSVTITGTGFTGTIAVRFSGASAVYQVISDTQITATVPFGVSTGPITVENAVGNDSSDTIFTTAPIIYGLSPDRGPVSTQLVSSRVEISGSGLFSATSVTINGLEMDIELSTTGGLLATIPNAATTGPIVVTTPDGVATSPIFTVQPTVGTTVDNISPPSGAVGDTVTISGTLFTGATNVTFGGVQAAFTVVDDTRITATVPVGAVTGVIQVTTPTGGTATGPEFFTVTGTASPPTPTAPVITAAAAVTTGGTITTFDRGPVGIPVNLTGTGFTGTSAVTFGGVPALSFTINSDTSLTAVIPAPTGQRFIQVTTPTGPSNLQPWYITPYGVRAAQWQLVGGRDFNADNQTDLVWRNYTTGENVVWFMNGTTFAGAGFLPSLTDGYWELAAAADFTNDGQPDLLWHNYQTGDIAVWQLNGLAFVNSFLVGSVADTTWQLAGAADLTNDGQTDLLWRNFQSGDVYVWRMSGYTYQEAFFIGNVADPTWQLVGGADFTADGGADLMWRNYTTGQSAVWQMNGYTYVTAFIVFPEVLDTTWQWVGAADLTGDGKSDLLWRNITDDAFGGAATQSAVWQLDGLSFINSFPLLAVPAN